MSDGDEANGCQYELVIPFVVVASVGGPYADNAFVAGYRCGRIDAALSAAGGDALSWDFTVEPALLPQLDLLAMHHGYTMRTEPWDDDPHAWVFVCFERTADDEGDAQ